jgi:hypothetical protein
MSREPCGVWRAYPDLRHRLGVILLTATLIPAPATAGPAAGETTVLGPLVGEEALLHPDNLDPHRIRFYGTDLGWTYPHDGVLHILFGDTMADEDGAPIDAANGGRFEDSFGTIDLSEWRDPSLIQPGNLPRVRIGQIAGSVEAAAINPGHAMEGFKTPVGGFSNGEREFGVFFTYKPLGCRSDNDCTGGMSCDRGLGYVGAPWETDEGVTFACVDGSSPACVPETIPAAGPEDAHDGSGFCIDRTSSVWAATDIGRTSAVSVKLLVGTRDPDDPARYGPDHEWHTNKFLNVAVRTVASFDPGRNPETKPLAQFKPAREPGPNARVFLWGRPGFVGVGATGRDLGLYFAYADLPRGPGYSWNLQYFAGLDEAGRPRFKPAESAATAIDLDSSADGVQADESIDVVNQMSISWIPQLGKWAMFYGGGMTNLPIQPALARCGVLELFAGSECTEVEIGNGGFRLRTADHPWGPWSPPQDILAAGDPQGPPVGQYGIGGMLRHPDCNQPGCAPHTSARDVNPKEYGFFYSANIIEQWTRPAGDGVDVIWNASTWDPYRVILLRTRIHP